MKYFSIKKGFTLIELLVVIAIIAILTAIVTANFTQAKAKSRDAKRISDIAQIQLTLEMVFDRCNAYPTYVDTTNLSTNICTVSGINYNLGYFISKIPTPPTTVGTDLYTYTPSGTTDYVLRAKLETNSSALTDDIDGMIFTNVDCSDSATNYYYCVQPK